MDTRIFVSAVFVLTVAFAAPPATYDQRQEGDVNVHAHLENFVIVLIPSSGLSLADIASLASKNVRAKPYYHHTPPYDRHPPYKHNGKITHSEENVNEEPRDAYRSVNSENNERTLDVVRRKSPYNIDIDATKHSLSKLHPPQAVFSDVEAVVIAHSPPVALSKSIQRIADKDSAERISEKTEETAKEDQSDKKSETEQTKEENGIVAEENKAVEEEKNEISEPNVVPEPEPEPKPVNKDEVPLKNEEDASKIENVKPVPELHFAGEKFRIPIKPDENQDAVIPVEIVEDKKMENVDAGPVVKEPTVDIVHEGIKVSIIPTEEQKTSEESVAEAEKEVSKTEEVSEPEKTKEGKYLEGSSVITPEMWKSTEHDRKRLKLLGGGIEECQPGQRRNVNGGCDSARVKHRSLLAALRYGLSPASAS